MLDINYIKDNLDKVKKSIEARKLDINLEELLKPEGLDKQRKEILKKIDEINRKRRLIAEKGSKHPETSSLDGKTLRYELYKLEDQLRNIEKDWNKLMLQVPNILMDEVPIGDTTQNKIIRKQGEIPKFSFTPKDHIELGKSLDIIDFDRGVKVSGFRGYYLKNEGARLQMALVNFTLDHLIQKGYQMIIPPAVNRRMAFEGTGWFPWGEEETYKLEGEDLFLAGTAEVPVTALHADEVLSIKELPKKYVAFSPCFRTEVGSYGKDTKGLYRLHEFYKVEQVIVCEAEEQESIGFFEEIEGNAEEILQMLGLPYRVVVLASEDMGKKAALNYDIETWMSSREAYGETHSNSILLDFQARRLKIRYKDKDGKVKVAHTLNNTAIASPRILIALLENNQQEDGSVKIPEVLHKYTGFSEIKPK